MTHSLVVGAGSIGSRHAALLAGLGHDVSVVSSRVDAGRPTFATIAEAVSGTAPEYVVVATETSRHADSVAQLAAAGFDGPLLVEKPLAVDPAALADFSRIGVGFNLRFHPAIVRLGEVLAGVEVYTAEVYAGQHLSQWRPDRPVAEQYSSSAARGGGVLRDLSHEFDYLALLLGPCLGLFARGGRLSALTADSDDAWGIVAQYERAPVVTVQLNYLDARSRRRIVMNTSAGTIEADVVAGTLRTDTSQETFTLDRDATYRSMHEAMLSGGPVATVAEAAATDEVIAMVERSAAQRKWVER